MVLDCYDEMFVWVGAASNAEERNTGLKLADQYLSADPSGRDPDSVTMFQLREGCEPPNFRAHFVGWDFRLSKTKNGKRTGRERDRETRELSKG